MTVRAYAPSFSSRAAPFAANGAQTPKASVGAVMCCTKKTFVSPAARACPSAPQAFTRSQESKASIPSTGSLTASPAGAASRPAPRGHWPLRANARAFLNCWKWWNRTGPFTRAPAGALPLAAASPCSSRKPWQTCSWPVSTKASTPPWKRAAMPAPKWCASLPKWLISSSSTSST